MLTQVKLGILGMLNPMSTVGLKWEPWDGLPRPKLVNKSSLPKGCQEYKVRHMYSGKAIFN
jgi:hypothetical protein